jgi:trk system potassium uptake protein TrkA
VKIVIVGCGRVGASAAEIWDGAGHEVIVLDVSTRAFERLPSSFGGDAIRGDGTDEDVLRRAGMEGADIFLAMTEGDNRNVMAAQLAVEAFDVPRVIAKINDPVRAAAYAELGIATLCRTGLMVDAVNAHLGFPPSGLSGMLAPSGYHPGGDHHAERGGSSSGALTSTDPVPTPPSDPVSAPSSNPVSAAPGATMEA